MSTKLNAIYQYIDDIVKQTENNDISLNEIYKEYSKFLNERDKGIIKIISIIISIIGFGILPIQLYTLSFILIGISIAVFLILYFVKRHIINEIDEAVMYRRDMHFNKIKCFLYIRKEINFYHHARIDLFLKDDNLFTDKISLNIFWALYNLDLAFNIFNLDYYKLLYKVTYNKELKLQCINSYFLLHDKLLTIIQILSIKKAKPLPFFVSDEINNLVRDNLKYLPKYYQQPDAKIKPDFDISIFDLVSLKFGGVIGIYKKYGYQKTNLFLNSNLRKRFFIDKELNILKIE